MESGDQDLEFSTAAASRRQLAARAPSAVKNSPFGFGKCESLR
jgi:hypothetical protein